jgi:alpha-glucosidase (family GH31 glycosyl hydrolase)
MGETMKFDKWLDLKALSTPLIFLALMLSACSHSAKQDGTHNQTSEVKATIIAIPPDQHWWVGLTSSGQKMPLDAPFEIDLNGQSYGNQAQPLLLSADGHTIWSEGAFAVSYQPGQLVLHNAKNPIIQHKSGNTLKDAFLYASKHYFPPSGKMPDEMLMAAPQYNTWIELTYNQNQDGILRYARDLIKNGFPPGVLMIDDTWQEAYGKWRFHPGRFPDPKIMMDELHEMGFKVMLWLAPFVSPDSAEYRLLESRGAFIRESGDKKALPSMVRWWNGRSALLDFTNPVDLAWFKEQMDFLQREYAVDGFKFDAGEPRNYTHGVSAQPITANEHSERYAQIGLDYAFNEYRVTWKMGGQPLVQRLGDKHHNWEDLQKLIPQMNLMGLQGYPFSCPDLIGGGYWKSFLNDREIDQELIVRSTQNHALMPMMQFSVAPWRVLDKTHLAAVQQAVNLRSQFIDYILSVAKQTATSGEPIMRPLEYEYPHQGYAKVKDQFLIGTQLLVAPVVQPGVVERKVFIPKGSWVSHRGDVIEGPVTITEPIELGTLPYYKKVDQ